MTQNNPNLTRIAEELAGLLPDHSADKHFAQFIEKFKEFIQHLEKSPNHASEGLTWLEQLLDGPVYQEIGQILRKFHDQLSVIRKDIPGNLPNMNEEEVSAMSDKLEHIMEMTSNAAHETLDLGEKIQNKLDEQITEIQSGKANLENLLQSGDLNGETKKALEDQLDLLTRLQSGLDDNNQAIGSILIAQGYQDLTGQLIQKLLKLVRGIESDLLQLIQQYSRTSVNTTKDGEALKGPLREDNEAKHKQEDVNDLLTQFGF